MREALSVREIQAAGEFEIQSYLEAQPWLAKGGLRELGDAYIRGDWSCADLQGLLEFIVAHHTHVPGKLSPAFLSSLVRMLLRNPQRGRGAFEVGRRHYDLGNDLFRAMLDRGMSYTCGQWQNAGTLERAQENKLESICRKLKLEAGMRVLDIGCGWGNFARHAAERHRVEVVGLTVSTEQAEYAREKCRGLPVSIVLEDYRNFRGEFDRVVSIEMIEAVGRKNLRRFFETVESCLAPRGVFVLQAICGESFSRQSSPMLDNFVLWLVKYIFPNGYLPKLREICSASVGLSLQESVALSGDYERTLAAWRDNFESAWSSLRDAYGEEFRRMWQFYLCGCMACFSAELVQVHQFVFSKKAERGLFAPPQ